MADDVSGADFVLCSSAQATLCSADGSCESGPPWNWNIPEFIEIDFKANKLGTTEASGENRTTAIKYVERTDGTIFLQGAEQGRAFSFVIDEKTGMLSVAVARDGVTVSVFGACTPKHR
jgi:hypothetical protein